MYLTNDAILLDKNTKRNSEGRTVKFRFWNVSKKTMIVDNPKLFISGNGYIWKFKDHFDIDFMFYKNNKLIPLQWTGLLDKNSKEVYEGDILDNKTVIVFDNLFGRFGFTEYDINAIPNWVWSNSFNSENIKDFKVIGNIYQNPELLIVKNDNETKTTSM